MENNKRNIKQFDGEKYGVWKFRVRELLSEKNLLTVIDSDPPPEENNSWLKNERKARCIIVENLSDTFLNFVKDNSTPRQIFSALDSIYERKSLATQLSIRKQLLALKLNSAKPLLSHFIIFDNLITELSCAGGKLDEMDKVSHLLLTLPSAYNGIVTAIETLFEDNLTLAFVKTRLLDHETKMLNEEKDTSAKVLNTVVANQAFKMNKFKRNNNNNNNNNFKNNMKWRNINKKNSIINKNFKNKVCFYCGKSGHLKKDCYKYKNDNNTNKRSTNNETNMAFAFMADAAINNINKTMNFLIDSGASDHLTKDDTLMENAMTLDPPVKVAVAKNGAYVEATKKGNISFTTKEGNTIMLKNVLLCKDIPYNLLSVSRMQEAGLTVEFARQGVLIRKGDVVVMHGKQNNNLYYVNFVQSALCTSVSDQSDLWHKRLGHIGKQKFIEIKSKNMFQDIERIKSVKPKEILCESCINGKQTRNRFAKAKNKENIQRELFVVHTDVCGPITPATVDNKNYFVIFVDQYTHYCVTYLISRKSQVFDMFKDFAAKSEAHFNTKIVNLYCDNGREYLSQEMKEYCAMRGISYHLTIPYTPKLNGVSERMIRTITEKARAMVHGAGLPKEFWGEAVLTATYLINITPSNALAKHGKTPYELWQRKKPILKYLKVFGSTVHVLKKIRKSKFEEKSSKYVLVGYVPNGYKLWSVEKECFETARDVIVDENEFIKSRALKSDCDAKSCYESEDLQDINPDLPSKEIEVLKPSNDANTESEKSERSNINMDEHSYPELRRSKRLKKDAIVSYTENDSDHSWLLSVNREINDFPNSFKEIEGRSDEQLWQKAIEAELVSHEKNRTWSLVDVSTARNIVDCKWVFTKKTDELGNVTRYKARLVARGFTQEYLIDYNETFAPVVKISSFRFMLAFANNNDLLIHHMDVKTAFLNGELKEDIFMKLPEGISCNKNLICKLNKAIYGLKQAARCWFQKFDEVLKEHGFRNSSVDHCIYILNKGCIKENIYLLLYVDDVIIITASENKMKNFKNYLNKKFEMTDMGFIKYFIGIRVEREQGIIKLSQKAYIEKVLQKFGMENSKPIDTPLPSKISIDELNSDENYPAPCRNLIGSLMFIMLCSRPDLSISVNILSRYANKCNKTLWQYLKRILRYLKGSIDLKLEYSKCDFEQFLIGYVDSDWGGDLNDRKSTTGFIFKLYENCLISWNTRRQVSVAASSTEAEYMALFEAVRESLWLKSLAESVLIDNQSPIVLYEDNMGCINIANNPTLHKRTKHIDIKYHFTREQIEAGNIILKYIPTNEQVADALTKLLPTPRFIMLRNCLGLK